MTGWARQKLMAALIRGWLKHWVYNNPEALLRYLRDAGFPGRDGPELFVALSQPDQREQFVNGLVYALDKTIEETTKQ